MSFLAAELWEATRPRYTFTAQSIMHRRQVLLLGLSFDALAEQISPAFSLIQSYPRHIERYKDNLVQCLTQPLEDSEVVSDLYCILIAQRMDFQPIALTATQHALVSDIVTALELRKTRRLVAAFLRQRCIEHLQRDATLLRQNTPHLSQDPVTGRTNDRVRETRNSPEWTKMYQAHEDFLLARD
jgi:hypothetical protein